MIEHLFCAFLCVLVIVHEVAIYLERQVWARRVDRLTEQLTGARMLPAPPRNGTRAPVTDEEEWALEQARLGERT